MSAAANNELRRVVLLGASNVTRCLSTAVETARRVAGGPLEVLAAFGHGRSYGMRMPLLFRELPGIVNCALWSDFASLPRARTAALITDVGNDLLYDVEPAQIAAWVETCIERLQQGGAKIAMTALPLAMVAALSPRRFLLMRRLLFPRCQLSHVTALERARELDQRLRAMAQERGLHLVEHRAEWYGLDPIHLRRGSWAVAWQEFLKGWNDGVSVSVLATPSLRRWLYLRSLAPEQRWLFGREFRRAQPTGRLADGTTLAFY